MFLMICSFFNLNGQNQKKLDSLYNKLKIEESKPKTYTTDTTRVNILIGLSKEYKNNEPQKAFQLSTQGLILAQKINYNKGEALCFNMIGLLYSYQGKYFDAIDNLNNALKIYRIFSDSKDTLKKKEGIIGEATCYSNIAIVYKEQSKYPDAIHYLQKSLELYEKYCKSGDKSLVKTSKTGRASCYNNLGNVFKLQGNYPKALEYLQKSLKSYEEQQDKKGIAGCLNNIGELHRLQGNFTKAIDYYSRSLAIWEELGFKKGIAICNNNIGLVLQQQKEFKKAIVFFQKSKETMAALEDQKGIANSFNNLGLSYKELHEYEKSLECYHKSTSLFEKIGDKDGIALTNVNMSELFLEQKKYLSAIQCGNLSYKISLETGSLLIQKTASQFIARANDGIGNTAEAYKFYKLYTAAKDSLFSQEKSKQLAQMEAIYQSEKKQKEIEILNKDKEKQAALSAAESRRQKIIIYAIVSFLLLVLAFAIFAYRSYLQKRKANILLAEQKQEIQEKNAELRQQNDEIEAQRNTLDVQNHVLAEQKKEITDSITYAKRIQQVMLPDLEKILNSFVLFKPKDIVSGDFYWATQINEFLIVTVADCTGHGVPGAFMSMLGVSFLNEIVRKKEVIKASEVLDHLRESVIDALQQKGQSGEQKDGMDIAFCVFNTRTNILQFAGANNPLYIVTSKKEFIEMEPDKQPVAIYENMKPFVNHEIQMNSGDCVFIASDGFEDQFGGPKNKKYMAKQLKELLVSISDKSMLEQCAVLDHAFGSWKGCQEQIDDVTVLGFKIL